MAILFAGTPVYGLGQEAMESTKKYQILFETTEHRIYCKASVWVEYNQYEALPFKVLFFMETYETYI